MDVCSYGLADNEDNIPDIIKVGALQRLMDCSEKLSVQASKVMEDICCLQNVLSLQTIQGEVLGICPVSHWCLKWVFVQMFMSRCLRVIAKENVCPDLPCPQDCVQKTITRMEQKLQGRVLSHVVFMLRSSDKLVQQRSAMSLAKLAPESEIKNIFVDKRGLEVLLDMLVDQVGCRLGWQVGNIYKYKVKHFSMHGVWLFLR